MSVPPSHCAVVEKKGRAAGLGTLLPPSVETKERAMRSFVHAKIAPKGDQASLPRPTALWRWSGGVSATLWEASRGAVHVEEKKRRRRGAGSDEEEVGEGGQLDLLHFANERKRG